MRGVDEYVLREDGVDLDADRSGDELRGTEVHEQDLGRLRAEHHAGLLGEAVHHRRLGP